MSNDRNVCNSSLTSLSIFYMTITKTWPPPHQSGSPFLNVPGLSCSLQRHWNTCHCKCAMSLLLLFTFYFLSSKTELKHHLSLKSPPAPTWGMLYPSTLFYFLSSTHHYLKLSCLLNSSHASPTVRDYEFHEGRACLSFVHCYISGA